MKSNELYKQKGDSSFQDKCAAQQIHIELQDQENQLVGRGLEEDKLAKTTTKNMENDCNISKITSALSMNTMF